MPNSGLIASGRPALQQARSLRVSGLPGAQAFSEYAGATESGAPTSGTFRVGQWVIDQSGSLWLCTAAGSPGTWTEVGGGGGGTIDGAFSLTGSVTPASFGAQQDDYDPAGLATASVLRLEGTGGVQLVTGLAAQSDGRVLLVHNIGSFQIRFAHEHTSSAAANRFHFPWGGSGDTPGDEFYLTGNATLTLRYDGTLSRWLVWPGFQSHTHGYDLEGLQLYPDDVEANVRLVTSGELRLAGITSPAQLAADQNDYHPGDNQSVYRLSSDASRTITGLNNNQALYPNQVLLLCNVGSNPIVLADESASSTAANRFALDGDLTLAADTSATIWYDDTSSRWRLLSVGKTAAGTGGSMTSFSLAGDGGTPQTIGDGNTLTVAGGAGLASTAGATDTVTLDLDINSLTADASPDGAADYVATYDASSGAHKKVLLNDLPGGGSGAPTDATYLTGTSNATLSAEVVISRYAAHPDATPASPDTLDDEFTAGSLDAKWTWVNQGTSTATLAGSHLSLLGVDDASVQLRGIYQAITGTSWKIRTRCAMFTASGNANNQHAGLLLREAATGKCFTFGLMQVTPLGYRGDRWTNATTWSASLFSIATAHPGFNYFEIERATNTLYFRYSLDGVTFVQLYTEAITASFTTAPDQVGLFTSEFNSNRQPQLSVDWFRKVA